MYTGIDGWTLAIIVNRFIFYIAVFTAVGGFLFAWLLGITLERYQLRARIALGALLAAITATAHIFISAGFLWYEGLSGMFNGEMLALVLTGPDGQALLLRLGGAALLTFAAFAKRPWLFRGAGALSSIGFLAAFGLVGHATEARSLFVVGLTAAHLAGSTFWIGSFGPLIAALRRDQLSEAADMVAAFGRMALWFVALLVGAGVLYSWQIFGSPFNIVDSAYGLALGGKMLLVMALLGLAALNKLRFTPALAAGNKSAAKSLVVVIRLETLLAFGILALMAFTTATIHPLEKEFY